MVGFEDGVAEFLAAEVGLVDGRGGRLLTNSGGIVSGSVAIEREVGTDVVRLLMSVGWWRRTGREGGRSGLGEVGDGGMA